MNFITRFDQFHRTSLGLVAFALIELGLGMLSFVWAKNGGGLLAWFVCSVFVFGFMQNSVKFMGKHLRGSN